MKIFIVDNLESKFALNIANELMLDSNIEVKYLKIKEIKKAIDMAAGFDVVFWMIDKEWASVKKAVPTAIVIGYQNIVNETMKRKKPFVDILNESLLHRDNLTIAYDNSEYLCYDPLGTLWYKGSSTIGLVSNIMSRIRFLLKTHRERTFTTQEIIDVPNNEEFFSYVRDVAEIFHTTIQHSSGVTRLLGNASFRGKNGVIYATERDVDKALVSKDVFIPSFIGEDGKTMYSGSRKPSKDTVVQLKFYNMLPNINYIVHSHCYVAGAPYTKEPVPCGAIEEISEVKSVIEDVYNGDFTKEYYAINLIGHGCLVFASNLNEIKQAEYFTRRLPETLIEGNKCFKTNNKEPKKG